ncbi:MAG: ATP-binding protein [Opitutaceae bacterium]|nr:ATP-binding protein [Opitutaceae bacterium]
MPSYIQGSLFEKDYLLRTLGSIVHDPGIALTELVANCWDAGASSVYVTIPNAAGGKLQNESMSRSLRRALTNYQPNLAVLDTPASKPNSAA